MRGYLTLPGRVPDYINSASGPMRVHRHRCREAQGAASATVRGFRSGWRGHVRGAVARNVASMTLPIRESASKRL